MGSALFGPVNAALFAALTADASLMAVVTGVFDEVPEGTASPYVVLGEAIETPDNSHDARGWATLATLHVWSEYRGFAEASRIAAHIVRVLDGAPLAVEGYGHVATRYEYAQTLKDPDKPGLRHAVIRVRVVTTEE